MNDLKTLFLQDICSRILYKPKCLVTTESGKEVVMNLVSIDASPPYYLGYFIDGKSSEYSDDFKPFLLPFDNLSPLQYEEYLNTCNCYCKYYQTIETFDWLYANHVDFRGLIKQDLALPVWELEGYLNK